MLNADREIFIKKCLSDLDQDRDTLPRVQAELLNYVENAYGKALERFDISPGSRAREIQAIARMVVFVPS